MNVHHITSKNFINYGKGSDFHEIFDVFGVGIFNLDSNEWKQERKMLHSLFKRKSFEIFIQQNIQKKLENCLIPFLEHASKGDDDDKRSRKNQDLDESHSSLLIEIIKKYPEKGEIVEKYIRDTGLNLLSAGNGTISSGLSWFFWLVSTRPIVEAKIIQEIKDNCLTQDADLIDNLSLEKLDKLVYLHGAICETLRLYPPVPFQHKCAIKSDVLPSGHYVKPNTKLIYSLYAMGRMEQIWGHDCLEFKPERWISDKGKIIHIPSYKFIAFNAGPRSCLGKDISFIQMKMVAASILWNFQIQVVEGHSATPRVAVVLRMEHGLKVKVNKRCG
ncbi:alkane hydroxylase MAH1 [Trifolium repens]|nr:alkane hydroxylase MAH1 [Trifolium repens]